MNYLSPQTAKIHPDADVCSYGECQAKRSEKFEIRLCNRHAIAAYREVHDFVYSHFTPDAEPTRAGRPRLNQASQVGTVYFMEFGDRVKIGFTTNLGKRKQAVPNDRVLATIPGTLRTELEMHQRFAESRIHHEWFHKSPELMAFIQELAAA